MSQFCPHGYSKEQLEGGLCSQCLISENTILRKALERVEKNTRMGPLLADGTIQAVRDALKMINPKQTA